MSPSVYTPPKTPYEDVQALGLRGAVDGINSQLCNNDKHKGILKRTATNCSMGQYIPLYYSLKTTNALSKNLCEVQLFSW